MADIAPILLLPPPQRLPSQALTPRERNDLAAGDANGVNDAAQARRFRFRVYEGGDTGVTNTRYDARRADSATNVAPAGNGVDDAESSANQRNGSAGRAATIYQRGSGSGASSAFLAQSIAQEQLGAGLHNPPNAAATHAYNSTGAAVTPRASAGVNITV